MFSIIFVDRTMSYCHNFVIGGQVPLRKIGLQNSACSVIHL